MAVFMMENGVRVSSYEGSVLALREKNGYDDSDFYAKVWLGTGSSWIMYDTTRFASMGSASVDATPEVIALNAEYEAKVTAERKADLELALAAVPSVGCDVEIVLKAGKNKAYSGEVARVFWVGPDAYARSENAPYKVGVELAKDGAKLFLSMRNVKVVGSDVMGDSAMCTYNAKRMFSGYSY